MTSQTTHTFDREYDTIVIGAGMSGLGAGIRLAMFDKKVLILEKHSISGGLNSYYTRFKRPFDVGLHAMTNFSPRGERKSPLGKLLKQLRIKHEQLNLSEQKHSTIVFPDTKLSFTNEFSILIEEIAQKFPHEIDGFLKLVDEIKNFNEVSLKNEYQAAKSVVSTYLKSETLIEMIFCPLLIYGSAWEDDMDFSQFVIMFKSIYLEGFCRPEGGVRTLLNLLLETYEQRGGELEFKHGVEKILYDGKKVIGVQTTKGEKIKANKVLSSMGAPETYARIDEQEKKTSAQTGRMTFTETIFITDKKPSDFGFHETIYFYNNRNKYLYRNPQTYYDDQSAVICFPNNFQDDDNPEGIIRVTFMADYTHWKKLLSEDRKAYREKKKEMGETAYDVVKKLLPNSWDAKIECIDTFTPTTIERYTGHFGGTVYGSPDKSRDGTTPYQNLYLCGTDQGFLGIVGSLLSGISMANLHVLSQ